MRAVETLIVVTALLTLVTIASGWAYVYTINQSKAGEVTYAINVMLQLAETIEGIVSHKGGSGTLQFDFRYGAIVSTTEVQHSVSVKINGASLPTVYGKTCKLQYSIPFSAYPPTPILDRGTEVKTVYVVSPTLTEDANLVFHYSELGRTFVAYDRRPIVSIARTGGTGSMPGKVSVHVIFTTFNQVGEAAIRVALKSGPATFVLERDDISSFYMPLSSATPTVEIVLQSVLGDETVDIGDHLEAGDLIKQGDLLEIYVHQLTVAVR